MVRNDKDQHAERFLPRLAAADWDGVAGAINDNGCALLPRLLTPGECAQIAALYEDPGRFRATINMERYRFGRGEYKYFAGHRTVFDLPLDFRLAAGFRRAVLAHLPAIPYGRTESYAQVATAAGNPKAVRAAGTACARNPLPVVVPCHRVVRSDGTAGGYAGGPDAKRALLALESAA